MTVKEREKQKNLDKHKANQKRDQIAAHKKKEREEKEEMAKKMREINEL